MSTKATLAMFFANEVWAVYGIGAQGDGMVGYQAGPMGPAGKREGPPVPSSSASHTVNPTHVASHTATNSAADTEQPSATETVPFNTPTPTSPLTLATSSSAPSTPPAQSPNQLETGVKIGIAVLASILTLALLAFLLESCFLRPRRREKALQRAVQEVESGERAERQLAELKHSQEIVVLESRVSIVFDDGESGDESEDGMEWEGERGRTGGRNGMSLARREY